jgi:CheY-like chemotaxis protein
MTNVPVAENVNVLLVEDDEVDVEVVQRLFKKNNLKNTIYHAESGIEALALLRGSSSGDKIPPPYVILVDLNMPRMGGLEFLGELRNDEELKKSVAFVLTTSARDTDIEKAYTLNAAGYFLKDNMQRLADLFSAYRQINRFPGAEAPA